VDKLEASRLPSGALERAGAVLARGPDGRMNHCRSSLWRRPLDLPSACSCTAVRVWQRALPCTAASSVDEPADLPAGRRTRATLGAHNAGPHSTSVASIIVAEPWGRTPPAVVGATSIEQVFKRRSRTRSDHGCHGFGQHTPGFGLEEGAILDLKWGRKAAVREKCQEMQGVDHFLAPTAGRRAPLWPPLPAVAVERSWEGGGFGAWAVPSGRLRGDDTRGTTFPFSCSVVFDLIGRFKVNFLIMII
jgi:hypothetical protein